MIRRKFKQTIGLMAIGMMLTALIPNTKVYASTDIDYKTALKDAVIFYDANKCGKDVCKNNYFDFRGACHTTDGKNVGLDLTGGYHDAGDHVKFGLPQAYAASVMGYALYEFKGGFDKTGNTAKQLEQLKYFTDYFLKCHPQKDVFYYQVGSGSTDHGYWGAPEKQQRDNYLKRADSNNAASDVLGQTAAALSIMYLNYKDIDSNYANKCLNAAKELYNMGKNNRGCGDSQGFYDSDDYSDELSWGAIWLYKATNNKSYLEDAKQFIVMKNQYIETTWTMCWKDMKVPATLELWKLTGDQKYKKALDFNMNYWKNDLRPTNGGLKCLTEYGSLRYAAAASMIALIDYKETKDESLMKFAQSQIDYILGKNPLNMSYMVGFGDKYPQHPHHRAANGYTYDNHDFEKPAKHVLTGAIVGGPLRDDSFVDDINKFEYTEVAIDYNAGMVGALAALVDYKYDDNPVIIGDLDGDGEVTELDLMYMKKYLSGKVKNIDKKAADINNDGKVNISDFMLLKKLI